MYFLRNCYVSGTLGAENSGKQAENDPSSLRACILEGETYNKANQSKQNKQK